MKYKSKSTNDATNIGAASIGARLKLRMSIAYSLRGVVWHCGAAMEVMVAVVAVRWWHVNVGVDMARARGILCQSNGRPRQREHEQRVIHH